MKTRHRCPILHCSFYVIEDHHSDMPNQVEFAMSYHVAHSHRSYFVKNRVLFSIRNLKQRLARHG